MNRRHFLASVPAALALPALASSPAPPEPAVWLSYDSRLSADGKTLVISNVKASPEVVIRLFENGVISRTEALRALSTSHPDE